MHDLPVEVLPAGSRDQRAAHRRADRLRGEAEQLGPLRQGAPNRRGDGGRIRLGREPVDGGVDVVERRVGLEEEIACEMESADAAVDHLEVDDDELSAGDLVFAVHGCQPTAPGRRPARTARPI